MPATPSLVSMRCLFFKLCCWLQHCIQWLTAIHWMQTTIEWLGIARLNRWLSPKFPSGLLSRLFSSYFNEGLFYFQVRVCDPCFDKFGLKEGSGPSTPKRSHGRPEVAADAPKLTKQVRIPVKFLIYLPTQIFLPGHQLPYIDVHLSHRSLYSYWSLVLWQTLQRSRESLAILLRPCISKPKVPGLPYS